MLLGLADEKNLLVTFGDGALTDGGRASLSVCVIYVALGRPIISMRRAMLYFLPVSRRAASAASRQTLPQIAGACDTPICAARS